MKCPHLIRKNAILSSLGAITSRLTADDARVHVTVNSWKTSSIQDLSEAYELTMNCVPHRNTTIWKRDRKNIDYYYEEHPAVPTDWQMTFNLKVAYAWRPMNRKLTW